MLRAKGAVCNYFSYWQLQSALRAEQLGATDENPVRLPACRDAIFEEFAVGQKFSSGTMTVSAERIKAFAREFDPQPFHVDEEAARHSFFGGLVASGWHTAAMSMRLFVDSDISRSAGRSARAGRT